MDIPGTHPVSRSAQRTLLEFNQRLASCQDEAYTIAYRLVGEETSAERIVQQAALQLYHKHAEWIPDFRLRMIQEVIDLCRQGGGAVRPVADQDVLQALAQLPFDLRLAVVLLDACHMDLPEASRVMRIAPELICKRLALARHKLSTFYNSKLPSS